MGMIFSPPLCPGAQKGSSTFILIFTHNLHLSEKQDEGWGEWGLDGKEKRTKNKSPNKPLFSTGGKRARSFVRYESERCTESTIHHRHREHLLELDVRPPQQGASVSGAEAMLENTAFKSD